uniref:WAP four-disulfide core domain protein 1 n=1 Tax=Equus caballus TaxID=9796 RepID=A0A9L0SY38_HORSE
MSCTEALMGRRSLSPQLKTWMRWQLRTPTHPAGLSPPPPPHPRPGSPHTSPGGAAPARKEALIIPVWQGHSRPRLQAHPVPPPPAAPSDQPGLQMSWLESLGPDVIGQAKNNQAEEAGGSRQPRADRCPPPPRSLPPGACQAARCQADSECPRHRRCCYNGCAYACLEAVPPPPVLDWLVQPKPRWLGGNGWLLDGPEETLQAEACSTTEDGAEPLLCPSGYECHILSPGDMAEGIPNRGQCVKQRRQADGRFLRHKFHREYPEGDSKNVAEHGKGQQRHFQ